MRHHNPSAANKELEDFRQGFANQYLGKALAYRADLLRRLGLPAPAISTLNICSDPRELAFTGVLAGVQPVAEAAAYLEELAGKLPDTD